MRSFRSGHIWFRSGTSTWVRKNLSPAGTKIVDSNQTNELERNEPNQSVAQTATNFRVEIGNPADRPVGQKTVADKRRQMCAQAEIASITEYHYHHTGKHKPVANIAFQRQPFQARPVCQWTPILNKRYCNPYDNNKRILKTKIIHMTIVIRMLTNNCCCC